MSQFVVWFDSSETGAPVLNNAAGSLIAVLDACLVNGFNSKTLTSLTVTSGVATATLVAHGFSGTYGKDILIEGATPVLLNGRKALTFVNSDTFTFDATGVSDGTATGTIIAKRDSLGWVKEFTDTNKAIYKRTDVTATTLKLRVLDTAVAPATATDARVQMVETATDVDTFTAQSPATAMVADGFGGFWNKSASNATAKQWSIVGNSKSFYLMTANGSQVLPVANGVCSGYFFGDLLSIKSGDAYNCMLTYTSSTQTGASSTSIISSISGFSTGAAAIVSRPYNQVGAAKFINSLGYSTVASGTSGNPVYPSPIDSGLFINPTILLTEDDTSSGYPIRGKFPGLCQLLGRYPFQHYQQIDSINALPNRTLLALSIGANGTGSQVGVDITGPWV